VKRAEAGVLCQLAAGGVADDQEGCVVGCNCDCVVPVERAKILLRPDVTDLASGAGDARDFGKLERHGHFQDGVVHHQHGRTRRSADF